MWSKNLAQAAKQKGWLDHYKGVDDPHLEIEYIERQLLEIMKTGQAILNNDSPAACIRVVVPADSDRSVIDKVAKEVAIYGHSYETELIGRVNS